MTPFKVRYLVDKEKNFKAIYLALFVSRLYYSSLILTQNFSFSIKNRHLFKRGKGIKKLEVLKIREGR